MHARQKREARSGVRCCYAEVASKFLTVRIKCPSTNDKWKYLCFQGLQPSKGDQSQRSDAEPPDIVSLHTHTCTLLCECVHTQRGHTNTRHARTQIHIRFGAEFPLPYSEHNAVVQSHVRRDREKFECNIRALPSCVCIYDARVFCRARATRTHTHAPRPLSSRRPGDCAQKPVGLLCADHAFWETRRAVWSVLVCVCVYAASACVCVCSGYVFR